ncbi:MAG TPA: CARDB domain-containing protein [Thermoanaerobaculia bacterium]
MTRSITVKRIRRMFVLLGFTLGLALPAAAQAGPDLDVTYIERTPRYPRYRVAAGYFPQQLEPGTDKDQRWPAAGETVSYIAHVINKGNAASGPFAFEWRIDGNVARTNNTSSGSIAPGDERTFTLQRPWTTEPKRIEFRADTAGAVAEEFEQNNTLTIGTHDLGFAFGVERGIYDRFHARLNRVGTRSFEDFLQDYVRYFNMRLGQAVYPVSPQGIVDRIRVDKIAILDEVDAPTSAFARDPDQWVIDGRWQASDGDPDNSDGMSGKWQQWVDDHIDEYNQGWMHEVAHQYGLGDLYRFGIKPDDDNSPRGGVWVRHSNGSLIEYSELKALFPVVDGVGGLMGGGTTTPHHDPTYFESHSAGALNVNAGLRRGHYGEYLFDTPAQNRLKIVDAAGQPVAGATVALFQKDYVTEDIDNAADITGVTDAAGIISLPNRSVVPVYTATGHVLRPNPFGQIHVVGVNGTFLIRVTKGSMEALEYLTLQDLNLAYWGGATGTATHTVKVTLQTLPQQTASPPVLDPIGSLFRVTEGQALTFTISASDPANDPLTYSAERLPPGATFANQRFTWTPATGQRGFYSVRFKVTDPSGQFDDESVLIAAGQPDRPPVARVGQHELVGPNGTVILDGTGSSDPDGQALSYFWTQTSGPAVTLTDRLTATPSFTAPNVIVPTKLTFSLTVAAYSLTSAPATVQVTIDPGLPLTGTGRGSGSNGTVRWRQPCSGVRRMLVVTTAEWRVDANSQVTGIDHDGQALTRLASAFNPATGALATMWYLVNPSNGQLEVAATVGSGQVSFGSSCWSDIRQGAPTFAAGTGVSGSASLNVDSSKGQIVVDAIATFGENPPGVEAQPGQTVLARMTHGQTRLAHSVKTGFAGTTAMGWTIPGPDMRWAMVGAAMERVSR